METSTHVDNGPMTRSKTGVKRSADKIVPSSSSGRKDYGLPTTQDSQGKNLFTRPSDGKLVYLHCCVSGCDKTGFSNVLALRNHVCSPAGLHKIKGLLTGNIQAIELCGRLISDSEKSLSTAGHQPFGAASVGDMTRECGLPSLPTGSNEYHLQSKASSQSSSDSEAKFGATLGKTPETFKAPDLNRAYRTRSFRSGSQTEPGTRADEAAEFFDASMTSDSEDSDGSEDGLLQGRKMSADQHAPANRPPDLLTCLGGGTSSSGSCEKTAGGDSAFIALAVDDQAVKKERNISSSPFLEHPECQPSPKTIVVALEAEQVPNLGTETNHLTPNIWQSWTGTGKRANSAPPVTPTSMTKRPRLTNENLDRVMRSCSRVVRK